jgi:hypothetical protein
MMDIKKAAKEYLEAGYSVIPLKSNKAPACQSWKDLQEVAMTVNDVNHEFKTATKIGIVSGAISGGLEVIDIDVKVDPESDIWHNLFVELSKLPLYSRLVISKTPSGGAHIYYRCNEIEGNQRLALKDNKALIETRGEGGYVCVYPSPGYTMHQGDLKAIPAINEDERNAIIDICRSFNQVPIKEVEEKPKAIESTYSGENVFEDFNASVYLPNILEKVGYSAVREDSERVYLLRPGETTSESSGNYHKVRRVWKSFSSSTEFEPEKAYNASQVFSTLFCDGDMSKAFKELKNLGYGVNKPKRQKSEPVKDPMKVDRFACLGDTLPKVEMLANFFDIDMNDVTIERTT